MTDNHEIDIDQAARIFRSVFGTATFEARQNVVDAVDRYANELERERTEVPEAVETESFEFLNELALAFRAAENHPRPQCAPVLEGVRAVLAHLTSAGRLIPPGGMALTAEQVEDVRKLSQMDPWWSAEHVEEVQARLRALFPATEPAEDLRVHNHTPHRGPGPDGHCAERTENGRLRGQCMADIACTVARCPKELEGDIEPFPCVLSAGHRERHRTADGLTWGYFAPAEPAEEETKAQRCPSEIEGWGCSLTNGHDGDHIAHDQDGPAYIWPASSPVVPAPAETEWQTWQEVPEGVKYYGVGDTYLDEPVVYVNRPSVVRHRVDDGKRSSTPDYEVESFAPFVAAEEAK